MKVISSRVALLVACLLALTAAFSIPARLAPQALRADLTSMPDEAGHFTTSVFVFDYLREGLPGDAIDYAKRYYGPLSKSFTWALATAALCPTRRLVRRGRCWR